MSPTAILRHGDMRAALEKRRKAKSEGKPKTKKKRSTVLLNSPHSAAPVSAALPQTSVEAASGEGEAIGSSDTANMNPGAPTTAPDSPDDLLASLGEFSSENNIKSFIAQELEELEQLENIEHNMEQQMQQLDQLEQLNRANIEASPKGRPKQTQQTARKQPVPRAHAEVDIGLSYNPQVGAALDAIVAGDLEAFKEAMLTIHKAEIVFESGDVAVLARRQHNLPNASCAACTAESLNRYLTPSVLTCRSISCFVWVYKCAASYCGHST